MHDAYRAVISLTCEWHILVTCVEQLVQEAAFGEDSPLGAPRLASKAKKLSVDQVLEYRTARFVRGNLVVAANGISQANLDATLSKHAGVVPAGSAPAVPPSPYKGGEVKVRTDLDGTSRLGLAFPVPAGEDGEWNLEILRSGHCTHGSTLFGHTALQERRTLC